MDLPASVEIVEVGPRDGLQNEKTNVPTGEKVALIEALTAAGLKRFEATSFVSPRAIPQLADAEDVLAGLHPDVTFGAHFHDTRGLAAANTVAALEAGITTFDSSVGGLGGSPNAPGAGGTRRPRTWSTCSRRWVSRQGWTSRRSWTPPICWSASSAIP